MGKIYMNAKIGNNPSTGKRHPNKNTEGQEEKGFVGGYKTKDLIKAQIIT